MAELTPEEQKIYFGPNGAPTGAGLQADIERAKKDPFGYWWDTVVLGKTDVGKMLAAGGVTERAVRNPNEARALGAAFQLSRDVRNAPELDAMFRQGADAGPRQNPYNAGIADQSRGAQLALMQQMRGQMDGPSIANMQGQRAMGQMGQQALMQGGRAGMLGAAQGSAGAAGDVGQARLAEVMRAQAGIGGAAGNLRSGDLRSADAQMGAALQQAKQDQMLKQFYASQGANLANAREQAKTNRETTRLQQLTKNNQAEAQGWKDFAGNAANLAGTAATVGGGGKK